jgi:hypothetical protein
MVVLTQIVTGTKAVELAGQATRVAEAAPTPTEADRGGRTNQGRLKS